MWSRADKSESARSHSPALRRLRLIEPQTSSTAVLMNHHTNTRKGAKRLPLIFIATLAIGLALSGWPAPSAYAVSGSTVFAITTTNTLLRFDSGAPGTIVSTTAISGLQVGEKLQGIDFRPANGQLY